MLAKHMFLIQLCLHVTAQKVEEEVHYHIFRLLSVDNFHGILLMLCTVHYVNYV